MSVPPRTEREQSGWEVSGEPPAPAKRRQKPDRLGIGLLALVLLAVIVAAVLVL